MPEALPALNLIAQPGQRRATLDIACEIEQRGFAGSNIEFFGLDDVMPGNLNERVPREHAKIPNVRNWAVRDYGNRVGIWRIMEVLTRYGIRVSAALNSESV